MHLPPTQDTRVRFPLAAPVFPGFFITKKPFFIGDFGFFGF
jgi:hypothetical protein